MAKRLSRCTRCGVQAEVDDVTILRVIGMLIAFQWRRAGGAWCKRCIDAEIVPSTLITATVGWLSVVSFFLTPIFLSVNAWNFIKTRSLQPPQ